MGLVAYDRFKKPVFRGDLMKTGCIGWSFQFDAFNTRNLFRSPPGSRPSRSRQGFFLVAVFLALLFPALCLGEETVVRDRTGRILERRVQQGNTVKVYDATGKLLRTEKFQGDKTTVRDRAGKLLETDTQRGNRASIRDRTGKLVGTQQQQGNTVVVRDHQGRIVEQRVRHGNRVQVRDATGRLLRVETDR